VHTLKGSQILEDVFRNYILPVQRFQPHLVPTYFMSYKAKKMCRAIPTQPAKCICYVVCEYRCHGHKHVIIQLFVPQFQQMLSQVYCFVSMRIVLGVGDFVSAHASEKKCELVVLLYSRVLIRDQMARRGVLCWSSE
jgi:hypothetical protein